MQEEVVEFNDREKLEELAEYFLEKYIEGFKELAWLRNFQLKT